MLKNVCNYASVNVCLFGQNDFMEMELISLGSKSHLQRCWLEWRSVWVSRYGPWYTGRKNPAIVAIAYDVKWSSATMVAVMIFQLTGICLVKFCDIASNCTQQWLTLIQQVHIVIFSRAFRNLWECIYTCIWTFVQYCLCKMCLGIISRWWCNNQVLGRPVCSICVCCIVCLAAISQSRGGIMAFGKPQHNGMVTWCKMQSSISSLWNKTGYVHFS